jgi:hypothetical protein
MGQGYVKLWKRAICILGKIDFSRHPFVYGCKKANANLPIQQWRSVPKGNPSLVTLSKRIKTAFNPNDTIKISLNHILTHSVVSTPTIKHDNSHLVSVAASLL